MARTEASSGVPVKGLGEENELAPVRILLKPPASPMVMGAGHLVLGHFTQMKALGGSAATPAAEVIPPKERLQRLFPQGAAGVRPVAACGLHGSFPVDSLIACMWRYAFFSEQERSTPLFSVGFAVGIPKHPTRADRKRGRARLPSRYACRTNSLTARPRKRTAHALVP
jgi:hypothetical protein